MRKLIHSFVPFCIAVLIVNQAMCQEDTKTGNEADGGYWRLLTTRQGAQVQDSLLHRYLDIKSGMLPSSDGGYLAQDQAELQTYYDLGMQYQYIESQAVRRQLKLPVEQGLFVEAVTPGKGGDKAGFVEGDLILAVGASPVDTQYDFVIEVKGKRGESCPIEIRREGEPVTLSLQLEPIDPASLEAAQRWIIGVSVDTASDALQSQLLSTGVVILELTENGPAAAGGMQVHDVITRINGNQISTTDDLREIIGGSQGKPVRLEYYRGGKLQSLDLTPIEEPVQEAASYALRLSPHITRLEPGPGTIALDLVLQNEPTVSNVEVDDRGNGDTPSADDRLSEILERIDQLTREVQELKERIK